MEKLNKAQAIIIVNQQLGLDLTKTNTVFSNVNKSVNVWWFEPHNDKFKADLNILLNNDTNKELLYFFIPAGTIKNPARCFTQRTDKGQISHIEIYVNNPTYQDRLKKEVSFNEYLKHTIKYENII